MAYVILRFAKHKGGASKALGAHHERTKEFYASNPDIDKNRTMQNYHIVTPRWSYEQEIRHRVRMAGCRVRKDSVKFVDTLVTVSPEFAKAHEAEMQEYFSRAFNFLKERVGEENIISAVVHMDEKTPHFPCGSRPTAFETPACPYFYRNIPPFRPGQPAPHRSRP